MPFHPLARAAAAFVSVSSALKRAALPPSNATTATLLPVPVLRPFCVTTRHSKKSEQLPPRPKLEDSTLKKNYLKGSGPGGQKINKTASAVQLTHLPTGIVIKSQATRSRRQNETIARRLLAEKVELLEKGAESRVAIKQGIASKKKRSAQKKRRRKYRRLAADSAQAGVSEDDQQEEEDEIDDADVGMDEQMKPEGASSETLAAKFEDSEYRNRT